VTSCGTDQKDKNQHAEIAENSLEENWRLELLKYSNAQLLFERFLYFIFSYLKNLI
jgi:hypothetical protein